MDENQLPAKIQAALQNARKVALPAKQVNGATGQSSTVVLQQPHQGESTVRAIAATDSSSGKDKGIVLQTNQGEWVSFADQAQGTQTTRRDLDRSSEYEESVLVRGRIKYVYAVPVASVPIAKIEVWVGGWQPTPVKVTEVFYSSTGSFPYYPHPPLGLLRIDNLGGNRCAVNIQIVLYNATTSTQTFKLQRWMVDGNTVELEWEVTTSILPYRYLGAGFWAMIPLNQNSMLGGFPTYNLDYVFNGEFYSSSPALSTDIPTQFSYFSPVAPGTKIDGFRGAITGFNYLRQAYLPLRLASDLKRGIGFQSNSKVINPVSGSYPVSRQQAGNYAWTSGMAVSTAPCYGWNCTITSSAGENALLNPGSPGSSPTPPTITKTPSVKMKTLDGIVTPCWDDFRMESLFGASEVPRTPTLFGGDDPLDQTYVDIQAGGSRAPAVAPALQQFYGSEVYSVGRDIFVDISNLEDWFFLCARKDIFQQLQDNSTPILKVPVSCFDKKFKPISPTRINVSVHTILDSQVGQVLNTTPLFHASFCHT